MDIIIRDASVRDQESSVDIGIADGTIEAVEPEIRGSSTRELDANGGLVLPTFVESHTHLDMAYFEELASPRVEGSHSEAIRRALAVMDDVDPATIRENAERAIRAYVSHGCTKIRTHVCITEEWEHDGLEAVIEAREALADLADVQIIAYQFEPGLTEEKYERMRQALELGADLVGGRPNTEPTDEAAKAYVDRYFELAKEYDADLDFHVDLTTDPFSRSFEYLAHRTIQEGYEGRVQAGHVCALPHYDEAHQKKVIDLAADADIHVVTNPEEDQLIDGLDTTSVRDLLAADVNVSIGHNDIANTFYPFGAVDPLEAAWLLTNVVGFNTLDSWHQVIDCVTHHPAETLGLEEYGVSPGDHADLTVCRESTVRELLRLRGPRRYVLKDGAVVAESNFEQSTATP